MILTRCAHFLISLSVSSACHWAFPACDFVCFVYHSCKINHTKYTIAKIELLVFVPVGVGRLPELTGRLHFGWRERRWNADIITLQVFSHPSYPSEGETSCPQRGGYVHTLSGEQTIKNFIIKYNAHDDVVKGLMHFNWAQTTAKYWKVYNFCSSQNEFTPINPLSFPNRNLKYVLPAKLPPDKKLPWSKTKSNLPQPKDCLLYNQGYISLLPYPKTPISSHLFLSYLQNDNKHSLRRQ
jgi:hypothetical protein